MTMKNLERDRRRKKGAIGSQDGGFRTFERRTGHADGRSATCILVGGADVTVYSVWLTNLKLCHASLFSNSLVPPLLFCHLVEQ